MLAAAGGAGPPGWRALLHDPDLGRPTQAARIVWQLSHHPLPEGLQVLHLCDHLWCVRPTHLVLGSQAANMADRLRKHWVRGRHPTGTPTSATAIPIDSQPRSGRGTGG